MDLSVIVTTHAEGALLRPTLRSVSIALSQASRAGYLCELVIVQDDSTVETENQGVSWLKRSHADFTTRIIKASGGDAGSARNFGIVEARGTFVAICDGDDLVSRNYFTTALDQLESSAQEEILHPANIVSFGARSSLWQVQPSSLTGTSYLDLIQTNLWPSASVAPRSTYVNFPYPELKTTDGFGPEDWLWNIQTSAAGIRHSTVKDSYFFYRTRTSGGVNNAHANSILPWFDVEALMRAMPLAPSSPALETSNKITLGRICRSLKFRSAHVIRRLRRRIRNAGKGLYNVLLPPIRLLARPVPDRYQRSLFVFSRRWFRRFFGNPGKIFAPIAISPIFLQALAEAAEVEPAVSWTAFNVHNLQTWVPEYDGYAEVLTDLVSELLGKSEAIIAAPWVGIGGADMVAVNYMKAVVASPNMAGRVTALTTYLPQRTMPNLIPRDVHHTQIPESWRLMTPDRQRQLLAQVMILLKPKLLISVNCFDVTNSLQLYGKQMSGETDIFLTLFAFDRIGTGNYPTNPITDDAQRGFLADIKGLITDNSQTASQVSEILGLDDSFVKIHRQPALAEIPSFENFIKYTPSYNESKFSPDFPAKIVWPHRLDKEKRPDALLNVVARASELGLPVQFHVHGQAVLSSNGKNVLDEMAKLGVIYHGPYSGGLTSIPFDEYHGLLLTSESEGLPLVVVQAMHLGLPVIASAVGGVIDIVEDSKTGFLTAGPDDVDGFIRAITTLMENRDLRRKIIRTAYDFAKANHGWDHFSELVSHEFFPERICDKAPHSVKRRLA